ncbi:MAG: COX15/CtaA family protein, partial [Anaerolineae bacterium]|nr:COX15/CtaA family protein [Anaerolineae bacterium]
MVHKEEGARADVIGISQSISSRLWLSRLTLLVTLLAVLLLLTGSLIRLSDGAACPDWPLCFNRALPTDSSKALVEVVHRVLAALTGSVALGAALIAWRNHVLHGALGRALGWAVGLLAAQTGIGAAVALSRWDAHWTALHLTIGLLTLGAALSAHIEIALPATSCPDDTPEVKRFRRSLRMLAGAVFLLMLSGILVSGNGAALACGQSFPLCNGDWLPNGGRLTFLNWLHRAMVFVVGALLLAILKRAFRRGADVPSPIRAALGLMGITYLSQGALGVAMVALNRPAMMAAAHHALSSALWLAAVAAMLLGARLPMRLPEPAPKPKAAWIALISDYIALTKPKVISLLLFTTLAGMFLTPAGLPRFELVFWTMIGGYLMAGGANAVNMAYDADID